MNVIPYYHKKFCKCGERHAIWLRLGFCRISLQDKDSSTGGLYGVRGEDNPETENWDREREPANRVHLSKLPEWINYSLAPLEIYGCQCRHTSQTPNGWGNLDIYLPTSSLPLVEGCSQGTLIPWHLKPATCLREVLVLRKRPWTMRYSC